MSKRYLIVVEFLLIAGWLLGGCDGGKMVDSGAKQTTEMTEAMLSALSAKRIVFGHQSVGNNIISGVEDLRSANKRIQLRGQRGRP